MAFKKQLIYQISIFAACTLVFLFITPDTKGQAPMLTQEQAIDTLLNRNYSINIARRQMAIAQNNADPANAGYHPTLAATVGGNYDYGGARQEFSNGQENVFQSAGSINGSGSISANYTIFDKSRAYTLDQLKSILDLSNLQLRQAIETNMLQVFAAFFETGRLAANDRVLLETLSTSQRRLEEAQVNFEFGSVNGLEVLNAQVDLERDSINYLNNAQALENAKHNLNALLGRDINTAFEPDSTIFFRKDLVFDSLQYSAMEGNVTLALTRQNLDITTYDYKLAGASRLPTISTTAAYFYSFQDQPSGAFIDFSTSNGLGLGVNINWNIYDGGLRNIREQNATINQDILRDQLREQELQLQRDLRNAWNTYQNALVVIRTERNNVQTSRASLRRTQESFSIGQVNSVEFRQAQLNLLNAQLSYTNSLFDAKLLEYEVLQLSGRLMDAFN